MFATVRQLKIKPDFKDENKRRVHDELLPRTMAIPGFVDYFVIYSAEDAEIAIGLFHDKKGADAYNKLADEFVKPFAPKVQLKSVTEGEVVVKTPTPEYA